MTWHFICWLKMLTMQGTITTIIFVPHISKLNLENWMNLESCDESFLEIYFLSFHVVFELPVRTNRMIPSQFLLCGKTLKCTVNNLTLSQWKIRRFSPSSGLIWASVIKLLKIDWNWKKKRVLKYPAIFTNWNIHWYVALECTRQTQICKIKLCPLHNVHIKTVHPWRLFGI